MITLEKIDMIVERTGSSYEKAKEALEITEGDVVEAIIYIEKQDTKEKNKVSENIKIRKEEIIDTLKELLKKGNVTRIIIEKEGKKYLEIPVNIAVSAGAISIFIGTIMIPVLATIGIGLYIGNFKIKVIKKDGSEVNVNEETKRRLLEMKDNRKNKNDDVIDITNEVIDDDKDDEK